MTSCTLMQIFFLGLIRGIGNFLTQYLWSLFTMDHKGCIATKEHFPKPT